MTVSIAAIPRRYAGVNFRSTLEADWASTLDDIGILWEYEPKTVTLPSGATYIPDFFLPELGMWIEVKGPGIPRIEKAIEFAETVACTCGRAGNCVRRECQMVLVGLPPEKGRHTYRHVANWNIAAGAWPYLTRCAACHRHFWHRGRSNPTCRNCDQVADFCWQIEEIEFGHASRVLSDLSAGPLPERHAVIVDGLSDAFRKLTGKPARRRRDESSGPAHVERASTGSDLSSVLGEQESAGGAA